MLVPFYYSKKEFKVLRYKVTLLFNFASQQAFFNSKDKKLRLLKVWLDSIKDG